MIARVGTKAWRSKHFKGFNPVLAEKNNNESNAFKKDKHP